VWGLLHGLFLVSERPFLARIEKLSAVPGVGPVLQVARIGVVFFCVSMAWVFLNCQTSDRRLNMSRECSSNLQSRTLFIYIGPYR
jgi:alginate O-acetyltransferase complex protein AlgI